MPTGPEAFGLGAESSPAKPAGAAKLDRRDEPTAAASPSRPAADYGLGSETGNRPTDKDSKPSFGLDADASRSPKKSDTLPSAGSARSASPANAVPTRDSMAAAAAAGASPKLDRSNSPARPSAAVHLGSAAVPQGGSPARPAMAGADMFVSSPSARASLRFDATNAGGHDSSQPQGPRLLSDTLMSAAEERTTALASGVQHSGWLHKLVGKTPQDVNWKRYFFYLLGDRLYYAADALKDKPLPGATARYIPLDRIPVRPLPHRRKYAKIDTMRRLYTDNTVPDIGISMVRKTELEHLKVQLKPDTCFGLVSGSHTFFFAADTPEQAQEWVRVLRKQWLHCFKHTLRSANTTDAAQETTRLLAQNAALRESLTMARAQPPPSNDYWREWLDEKARNRLLEDALANNAVYEIEVKTGKMKGASTSARVYVDLHGPHDEVTSGEIRLVNADVHQTCFKRNATDLFVVIARDVGLPRVIKLWHDNTGRHPDWFVEYVRVRKRVGRAPPGKAPYTTGLLQATQHQPPTDTHTAASVRASGMFPMGAFASPPPSRGAGSQRPPTAPGSAGSPASLRRSQGVQGGSKAQALGLTYSPGVTMETGHSSGFKSPLPTRPITGRSLSQPASPASSPLQLPSAVLQAATVNGGGMGWSEWVTFPCGRWFSTEIDDCRISRVLYAGHATPLIQYTVVTHTSDLRGAGTDANVFIALHGTLGDGDRHTLSAGPQDFERGTRNEFVIEDEELGDLLEITVGHDNTGRAPAWHLDHLTVTNNKTGLTHVFACRAWFDKTMGDGLIERVLPVVPDAGKLGPYTFIVHTSDIKGAGTDADVFVALHGTLGETPTITLPSRPEHFERGQTDTFTDIVLPYMGELRALTIGHNDKGAGPEWHLDYVEVVDQEHHRRYWFPCGKWFGSTAEDGCRSRTLLVSSEDPSTGWANYKVEFHTSNVRGAGTDAVVYFQLFGDRGESEVQRVVAAQEAFERGGIDSYDFKLRHMGRLRRMIVQHDNSGANPAWHLFKVVVTSDRDKAPVTFVCNDWIRSADPAVQPCVELLADLPVPSLTTYVLEVVTSDMRGAGTDSNVWVEIHGMQGRVGPEQLDRPGAFERGAKDRLEISGVDVGQITKIVVSCQPKGNRPLWHLDHITVWRGASVAGSAEVGVWFPCRQWFDERQGMVKELYPMRRDLDLQKILYRVTVVTSDVKGAGTDANIDMCLEGVKGETGWYPLVSNGRDIFERAQEDVFQLEMMDVGHPLRSLSLRSDCRSAKPSWHVDYVVVETLTGHTPPAFFVGRCWLGPGPEQHKEVKLTPVLDDPRKDRGEYFVWVHTSDVRYAGTDAGVCIELRGEGGTSSGKQPLADPVKDLFERAQVDEFRIKCRNLGPLKSCVVVTDGKSNKPNWHLDYICVQIPTGEKYYFYCGRWLGPECLTVELPASLLDPTHARRKYKVVTYTSDIHGAGTDANVYVDIRGQAGATGKQWLKSASLQCFEKGRRDEFEIIAPSELGALQELLIGHDNTGQGPAWHLEQVDVTDVRTGQTWYFDCNQWFDATQGDKLTERLLKPSLQDPRSQRTMYYICVKTSNMPGAATDARVSCELRGEAGATPRTQLKNTSAVNFRAGQTDEFQLAHRSLGSLRELVIGHDNSGAHPAWHCEVVSVTDLATRVTYWFDCNKWFDRQQGDGLTERVLIASLNPPSAKSETRSLKLDNPKNNFESGAKDVFRVPCEDVGDLKKMKIWSDGKGLGAAWHLDIVTVVSSSRPDTKYWFYCGQWLDDTHGLEKLLQALTHDPRCSLPTYTVTVHTSDVSGAGTDANVYVSMFGAKGESGVRDLKGPGNLFERNKTDVFKFKMLDLGELSELEVWHDNSGLGPGWHLNYLEVNCSLSGKVWYFPCNKWFDKKQGDGLIRRRLKATLQDPRSFNSDYRVTVVTSDKSGAGTDANVFIVIYGPEGDTGRVVLDNPMKNDFERGATDIFEFTAPSVGKPMSKIRIGHDGSGVGSGWHLNKVIVENLRTGECAVFECNRWFDKGEDDGAIERDLYPSNSIVDGVSWRLTVVTGTDSGAGTDANVFTTIKGDRGAFGPHQLMGQKSAFENGSRDTFSLTTPQLGAIQTLTLAHDGKGMGAAWQVDTAELENVATGEKWYFDFKCWLDHKHGMSATRAPSRYKGPTRGVPCNYRVDLTTGPTEESRMAQGAVIVDIGGATVTTGRQTLPAPPHGFQPSRLEAYGLQSLPDTGAIQRLDIGHTAPHPFYVREVKVVNETTGAKGVFIVERLIQPGEFISIQAQEAKPVDYEFKIETTDRFNAGTSARVFVNLFGSQGSTGRKALDPAHEPRAEGEPTTGTLPSLCSAADACRAGDKGLQRGVNATFVLKGLADVGNMQQLEIGHDNSGVSPGWHLSQVRVTNLSSGETALFPCHQWLAKNEGDKKIIRLLDADRETVAPPTSHTQLITGTPEQGEGATGVAMITVDGKQAEQGELAHLMRKMGLGQWGQPGYKVTFQTSNVCLAGTNAPVFFELVGENGSSGTVHARATMGQFARASRDEFIYPRMPFLGELLQVRVGTNGQGMFATWHLKLVEVTHISSNTTWRFNCHDWVDKHCGWQRVLAAKRLTPGETLAASPR